MLTQHIARLRIYNGKTVIVKIWNIVRGKATTLPIIDKRSTVEGLLERIIIPFKGFSNNTKFVNFNWRHSVSQYNEFGNVF